MGILEQKRKERLRKVAEESEASLNAGGFPNRYDEAISAWERMGEFEEAARVKELKKELNMDLEKKAIMFLVPPMLIAVGLLFIYFSMEDKKTQISSLQLLLFRSDRIHKLPALSAFLLQYNTNAKKDLLQFLLFCYFFLKFDIL